jgi:hypothetical protein
MSKALLDKALKAAQLYHGSMGLPVKTQQKFYARMRKAVTAVATKYGASEGTVHDQVTERAQSLGPIRPMPGKDY